MAKYQRYTRQETEQERLARLKAELDERLYDERGLLPNNLEEIRRITTKIREIKQ